MINTVILMATVLSNGTFITLFQENRAFVLAELNLKLEKGVNAIEVKEIPREIFPGSVELFSPAKGVRISSSRILYDLEPENLLKKYIGETVLLRREKGEEEPFTLESFDNQYIYLRCREGSLMPLKLSDFDRLHFPPKEGLVTTPTLMLEVESKRAKSTNAYLSYMTGGFSWDAMYTSMLDGNSMKFNGYAVIQNNTSVDFKNCAISLFAGEAHLVQAPPPERVMLAAKSVEYGGAQKVGGDFYLYKLEGKRDIPAFSEVKTSFLERTFEVSREYRFDSRYWGSDRVKLIVHFRNESDDPIPPGVLSMYVPGAKGRPVFVGESSLEVLPPGAKAELVYGYASDIKVDRKVKSRERISKNEHRETIEVKITNGKKEDIKVNVYEHPYGMWQIIEHNYPFEKVDANTVKFELPVKGKGSTTLVYTVRYRY